MEEVTEISKTAAPFGKEVTFQQVAYDNGFKMLRLRIREGKRFTMIDLDENTAKEWQGLLSDWLSQQGS